MTKQRGRPRRSHDAAKRSKVQLRLDAAEKQAFAEASALAGIPLAIWMRERLRVTAGEELRRAGRQVAFLLQSEPSMV